MDVGKLFHNQMDILKISDVFLDFGIYLPVSTYSFMKNWIVFLLLYSGFVSAQGAKSVVAAQDTSFVRLRDWSNDFTFDMKYATPDNFLKAAVYDCADCYLRQVTVKALISANQALLKKGYRIKIFDCYRPLTIQKKMWAIVPNPKYVADPAKGSIHNRGGAVDITLVDASGNELDMGTAFDHFGPEAAHGYKGISKKIRKNRAMLRKVMEQNGFRAFESEWWHYNLDGAAKFPLADFVWTCL